MMEILEVDLTQLTDDALKLELRSRGFSIRRKPEPDPDAVKRMAEKRSKRINRAKAKIEELNALIEARADDPKADFCSTVLLWKKKRKFFELIVDGKSQQEAAEAIGASAAAGSKWMIRATDREKAPRAAKKGDAKPKRAPYNPAADLDGKRAKAALAAA